MLKHHKDIIKVLHIYNEYLANELYDAWDTLYDLGHDGMAKIRTRIARYEARIAELEKACADEQARIWNKEKTK